MIIFQSVQKYFAILGVNPPIGEQVLTKKNSLTLILFGCVTIAGNKFLLFDASNFQEYIDCFYTTCTMTLVGINYAIVVWKTVKLFELIDNFQMVVQRREYFSKTKTEYEYSKQMTKYCRTKSSIIENNLRES